MTKTPGEFERPNPITKAEREARKAFRDVDAKMALLSTRLRKRHLLKTASD